MNWFVYAIQSTLRNYIYVGLTSDLKKRISQHNNGKERTTRRYRPFILIHHEIFGTRLEARRREIFLNQDVERNF